MNNGKKRGKEAAPGKIVLGIIVVLVIAGAVGSMGGNSTDSVCERFGKTCRDDTAGAEEQKNRKNRIPLLTRLRKTLPISLPMKITGTLTNSTDKLNT